MPGTVNFADWTLNWSIPMGWGGGLVISQARFRNTMVLWQGTQPFVLVPYHGGYPMFKDGINHVGAPFTPVRPYSANTSQGTTTPPITTRTPTVEPMTAVRLVLASRSARRCICRS